MEWDWLRNEMDARHDLELPPLEYVLIKAVLHHDSSVVGDHCASPTARST